MYTFWNLIKYTIFGIRSSIHKRSGGVNLRDLVRIQNIKICKYTIYVGSYY